MMKALLVIGGASLDRLHFSGRTVKVAGGAGMYTAVAAHRMGTTVTMYAPRPEPMPQVLRPLLERIAWIGPVVHPGDLPHFEITQYEDGRTVVERAIFGGEVLLDPADLPDDLSQYSLVHITPVGSVEHQLEFLQACRQQGALRISAGIYPCKVEEELVYVREVFEAADLFFMNEQEAIGLFGSMAKAHTSPGKLLFVTMGERGAMVIQGDFCTHIPTIDVEVLDPTGAGDTFCGSTLAGLMQGKHPILAARGAAAQAARMTTAIGPAALWEAPQEEERDPRVNIDRVQIEKVAKLINALPGIAPFDFTGPEFPPIDHPAALDYFFAATLQQFGFWETSGGRYHAPMIARIEGVAAKGSDYLWRAYLRRLIAGEESFYTPQGQAALTHETMLDLFRADDGSNPMPVLDLHLVQAHAYGRDMGALKLSPREIVEQANVSNRPLQRFLEQHDHIGGYKEDPLRKKAVLLATILAQRPERFLCTKEGDRFPPIIDYHLMRSCLRIGLLDVVDTPLYEKLRGRQLLQEDEEWMVRYRAYEAIQQVVDLSGKSMGAVDWFFFNARQRCPEMTEPECGECPVDAVCAHRKELFQPVLRTTFY
jgi:sugar/nucleoside kinase (ribokinase family)